MEFQIDPRIFRIQVVALNAFILIVFIVSVFVLGGSYLIVAGVAVVANLGYYYLVYKASRIVSIKASEHTLSFIYNKGVQPKQFGLLDIDLAFEERNHHNGGKYSVLVVRENGELAIEINPGNSGFTKDDLEALKSYCKREQEKLTGEGS